MPVCQTVMDCRAASLAAFNSAKHLVVANGDAPARGGKRVAA